MEISVAGKEEEGKGYHFWGHGFGRLQQQKTPSDVAKPRLCVEVRTVVWG